MTYQSYNKHCHNTNRMGVTIVKEIPLLRSPLTGITFNLDANTQNPLLAPSPPSPSAHLSPHQPPSPPSPAHPPCEPPLYVSQAPPSAKVHINESCDL